jgi:hypothetical protein
MGIPERLSAIRIEVEKLRTEIRILEEQTVYVTEVAEDARIRAVVSETPLADREAQEAQTDAAIHLRSLDEARRRLEALVEEQDRLLERLFEESS